MLNITIKRLTESFSSAIPKTDGRVNISHLDFIVYMVFHFFGDNKQTSIAGMRRAMIGELGIGITRGAFWERLAGNRLKNTMELLVQTLMINTIGVVLTSSNILQLLKIYGILLLDSTTIQLPDDAQENFPGAGIKAGIKWHTCLDLFSGKMEWFNLTESKKHDRNCFPPFELLKNRLIIFDLGYFDYQLMLDLITADAFFLCRLKSNSVVFIKEVVLGSLSGCIGKSLLSCDLTKYYGNVIEMIIEKTINNNVLTCRAIGFWNTDENCYHWYLTNILVPSKLIYPLYRLRWQIELIFKSCKNSLNADTINSANENIIKSLLLGSIAAYLSSLTINDIASIVLPQEKYLAVTFQRIIFVFLNLKSKYINCILNPFNTNIDILTKSILVMKNELYDPNYKKRETSKAKLHRLLTETECI